MAFSVVIDASLSSLNLAVLFLSTMGDEWDFSTNENLLVHLHVLLKRDGMRGYEMSDSDCLDGLYM